MHYIYIYYIYYIMHFNAHVIFNAVLWAECQQHGGSGETAKNKTDQVPTLVTLVITCGMCHFKIYIYNQYEIILREHHTQSLRILNFGNFWKFKVPHKFLLRRGEGGERKRETPPCSCTIMFRFLSLHEYDSTSRCSTVPGSWASFRFHGKLKMAILGSYFETLHGKQLCFTRAYEKIMRQLLASAQFFLHRWFIYSLCERESLQGKAL